MVFGLEAESVKCERESVDVKTWQAGGSEDYAL